MELLGWGPTGAVRTLSWYDTDPATVAELVEAVDSATASSVQAGDGGTYAFLAQAAFEFDDALLTALGEPAVVFLPPVVFRECGDAVFEAAGEAAALSRLHASLDDLLDVSIRRVRPFRRDGGSAALTERQQAALSAAVAVGYYEVPRTGAVADVADALDCAPSTAGELLRKAEARLVTDAVAASEGP